MWMEHIIIVGDIFKGFSEAHNAVLTRSEFYQKLLQESEPEFTVKLTLGQGVQQSDVENILASTGAGTYLFELMPKSQFPKALMGNTHKHRSQNVLVSTARRLSDQEFELDMLLDPANEFLSDHMSGYHVQGMALLEASRQAFLSITEQFFLKDVNFDHLYFVINSMAIDYKQFLFPVETNIHYKIKESRSSNNRIYFDVTITLNQLDKACATTDVTFTVFDQKVLNQKERRAAAAVVDQALQVHSPMFDSAA